MGVKKRNVYLKTIPIEEAIGLVKQKLDRSKVLKKETIPTHMALGRITASPIYAKYSCPTFHSSAMDGVAVKAEKTFTAREGNPVFLKKGIDFIPVNTGEPLPSGFDAVIMIEEVQEVDQNTISIEKPAFPWQHVRRIGEDVVATELILPQNHKISPYDIGALLEGGIFELEVWEKPIVYIIPTGDEVLDFEDRPFPKPGQVIESNSQVLGSLARLWGCEVKRVPPVPDDEHKLTEALRDALASDAHIVVVGAGSSAGTKDFTKSVMEKLGEVLVHGVSMMPGKPSILGVSGSKILVGAPGYPVSAVICFEQLLKPLISWICHIPIPKRYKLPIYLTRSVPSKLGQDEFLRVSIGKVGDKWIGTPLPRGAGMITTLTKAQGIVKIPYNSEGHPKDKMIEAELLVPFEDLESVITCIGSHDNTLDLLANELMGLETPFILASTHVGSIGGILALRDGMALMAGAHLFDPESEDFNFVFLKKYAPDIEVAVINLAVRQQGLIISKGNPKNITSIKDLTRKDVRFINRQKGAGTRILLDYLLKKENIDARDIEGYDHEEYTHMAVAVNVLTHTADCGMGIYAAAKSLDLDFIPIIKERYDLLIPKRFLDDPRIGSVLELLKSEDFKKKIEALGGYETYLTGMEMKPGVGLGK